MTLSQTFRTALMAIAGFLLTAVFHTGAVAQANSPQGSDLLGESSYLRAAHSTR